jgi:deazaflavin-dependent oxidoreductase (nitroreductase family)
LSGELESALEDRRRLAVMAPILTTVAVLIGVVLIVGSVFVFGIRTKDRHVLNAVRRFNHVVGNPLQMRSAGGAGAYASVIRHRGRSSGSTYETPIVAEPTADGFVIATVYGSETDWLKNVLASGSATIVYEGREYAVDRPEIVPMQEAAASFPAKQQRMHRRFGVNRCVVLRRVGPAYRSAA